MTIFFPDMSQFQAGLSASGAVALAARASEGDWLADSGFQGHRTSAALHSAFFMGYHFLESRSSEEAQAEFCHRIAGKTPLFVDIEPVAGTGIALADHTGTGYTLGASHRAFTEASARPDFSLDRVNDLAAYSSAPTIITACNFIDSYRGNGGIINLAYLPHWYWQALGSPSLEPLINRGIHLWTSSYSGYSDSSSFGLWQGYGGYGEATVGQYTDTQPFNGSRIDFNAYRGSYAGKQGTAEVAACLAEFRHLATTGKLTPPVPPKPPAPRPLEVPDLMSAITQNPHCDVVPAGAKNIIVTSDVGNQSAALAALHMTGVDVRVAMHKPGTHSWDVTVAKLTVDEPLMHIPVSGHDAVALTLAGPGVQAGYSWS
jgi:hypothetical protein